MSMMASVMRRAAALLLLPPVSVLLVAAVRCLGRVRVAARAQFPSGGSPSPFRYLDKQGGGAAMMPPVALYCYSEEEQQQAAECVFCLSAIEEGSEVRALKCRHLFHRGCLDRWLLARPLATCPLCRCRLVVLRPPWLEMDQADYGSELDDSDSDMMLFMACVHSRSSWLWPS